MNPRCIRLMLTCGLLALLSACASPSVFVPTATPPPPSPTPTSTFAPLVLPTAAAERAATTPTSPPAPTPPPVPRVVVQAADGSIQLVDLNGNGVTFAKTTARFEVGKASNAIGSTVYAITQERGEVYAIDARGVRRLDFIPSPVYGFAATEGHGGGTERLAWGTALISRNSTAEIVISAPNGADRKSVVMESFMGEPRLLMPMQWSPDGTRLYYSQEITGIGGYILFGGASGLWTYDLTEGKASELIKENTIGGLLCLDSVAFNEQWVATHCTQKYIRIVSLSDPSRSVRVAPSGDLPKFNQLGSAAFNRASTRIAFAVAKGIPDDEQGWVLVSDRLSGGSRIVAKSAPGDHFAVVGWIDAETILVQSHRPQPSVLAVHVDGSIAKVADGTFLAMPSNFKP